MNRLSFSATFLSVSLVLACLPALGAEPAKPKFRVALLSPGPVSDAGWNAAGYEGLKRIEKELGAAIAQVETKSPSQFEENFRAFGDKGFDVVFAHGFEYQDPADQLHQEYPKTVFIITSGVTAREPNVAPLVLRLEQPAYLCGVTAASLSRSGVAGFVGGMEIPSIRWSFDGFRNGFLSVNPQGKVLAAYVGNWEDAGAAKEATRAQIEKGADFIFHNADAAGLGMFQAVKEAKDRGVLAFGSNRDQNEVASEVTLASAVLDIPKAMVTVARQIQTKSFRAVPIELDLANQDAKVVFNPKLHDRVSTDLRMKLADVQRRIIEGKVAFVRK